MFLADNEMKQIFRMNMDGSEQSVLFKTTDDMVYTRYIIGSSLR